MLNDKPRKLLTYLYNRMRKDGRPQSVPELMLRFRWTERQVLIALKELADQGFIEWDPARHSKLKIIKQTSLDFEAPKTIPYWERELYL